MRRYTPLGFIALLIIGIPWYWPQDNMTMIAGVPAWVALAIVAGALAAALTIWHLLSPWPEEKDEQDQYPNA